MIVRNSPAVEEPPPSVDRPSSSSSGHVKSEFFEALSSGENEAKAFHSKFEEFSDRLEKTVDSHIYEKILHLKELVATLQKREERYKTVFVDKISVFRRASCEIFGHKIGMFVHKLNSIQALTANIAAESFNRRTLS
ncbi:hypothetical protein MLD38_032243 [Melastoma candidum]|uniref:Uncharacterized protein n=1 Tax=Melastoma candidum TaxID=119954 RepID=A0ACB9M308_9MYRT|nr:hypothetical protein MLD38_032243 [Melastoma candidum]